MTMQFNLKVEGLEDLVKKIRDPEITRSPVRGILLRAGNRGKKIARKESDGGEGKIPQTIVRLYDRQGMVVTVKSVMVNDRRKVKRLLSIEEGRGAIGPTPNMVAIANWMKATDQITGSTSDRKAKNLPTTLTGDERKAVVLLAGRISLRGTEGKQMFKKAFEDIEKRMPTYLKAAVKQIEKRWSKKHGTAPAFFSETSLLD